MKLVFATAAECTKCGEIYPYDKILTVCTKCGGTLLLQYDLALAAETISKKALKRRENTFWKFIEFLPLSSSGSIISLCEPYTPMFRLPNSYDTAFKNVYLKDDGRLPTGTFKARGMAVAVSRLKELGVKHIAVPSAGNAAAALAAYGAKAGIEVYAFMPKDASENIVKECIYMGAKVYLVDGLINDAAEVVKRFKEKYGWFDVSTNKQPYRFEGYKVMAFEIAEQFNWDPPGTIVFPTGGGEGIIGLWKGFKELIELGLTHKIPRLVVVQSSGCAPIVEAYKRNETEIKEAWKSAQTVASGLRVPKPYASYLILRAIRETNGMAVAVDDNEIISSMKDFLRMGIYACPEASSTLSSLNKIGNAGIVDPHEKILLYLTGNAMKYFDVLALKSEETLVLKRGADPLLTMGS